MSLDTVSIADATLASPQRRSAPRRYSAAGQCFNRRRDACFPATMWAQDVRCLNTEFQSQTRRLLPRNLGPLNRRSIPHRVSIADATLASPQRQPPNSRARSKRVSIADATLASPQHRAWCSMCNLTRSFQSQTRRLLPRNIQNCPRSTAYLEFQSQTRRLLPRNLRYGNMTLIPTCFNRRRDACFPATADASLGRKSGTFLVFTRQSVMIALFEAITTV